MQEQAQFIFVIKQISVATSHSTRLNFCTTNPGLFIPINALKLEQDYDINRQWDNTMVVLAILNGVRRTETRIK